MHIAARSYLTAGVAMVGATALIASPISPSAPQDIKVPSIYSAEVALTAGFDPITPYLDFFNNTGKNIGLIGQALLAQPAPILSQLAANQWGYIEATLAILQASATAAVGWATEFVAPQIQVGIDYLRAGDYRRGVLALWTIPNTLIVAAGFPLMGLLDTYVTMSQNFANVVATLPLIARALGQSALNVYTSFGQIGRFVLDPLSDAVEAGDIGEAISIIISAPAVMADFIINRSVLGPTGFVYNLLVNVPRMIAAAITPPAPPAPELVNTVTSLPSAAAQMVSLNAGSTAEEAVAAQAPAEETSGEATQPAPDSETSTVTEEEAPETETAETETPATDVVDETEGTDAVDETNGSEETTGTDETEDSEEPNGPKSPNGGTDLSGGNKAEPGQTGSGTNTGTESGSGSTDESDTPSTGNDAGTGSDTADSGNDAGGSNDGSDGGSDS